MDDHSQGIDSYFPMSETLIGSSLWLQSARNPALLRVWMTLLKDAWRPRSHGIVRKSVATLGHEAVVSVEETKGALDLLMAPDPESHNPANEGRRIAPLDPAHPYAVGWRILNWEIFHERWVQANQAAASKRWRDRKRHQPTLDRHPEPEPSPEPEPELIPEKKNIRRSAPFSPPTVAEIRGYAAEKGLADFDADLFFESYGAKGWMIGKSPMKDWHLAVQRAHREGWCRVKAVGTKSSGGNDLGVRLSKDGFSAQFRGQFFYPHPDGKRWLTEGSYRPDGSHIQSDAANEKLNKQVYEAMNAAKKGASS